MTTEPHGDIECAGVSITEIVLLAGVLVILALLAIIILAAM